MDLPEQTEAMNWEGASVVDPDGEPLGRCTGVFADVDTGATEWVTVAVEEHRRLFIPALDATETGGTLRVRFARGDVLAAPRVGDDEELSKADEVRLYEHYGVEHTSAASGSVLPSAASTATLTGAPQMDAGLDEGDDDLPPAQRAIDEVDAPDQASGLAAVPLPGEIPHSGPHSSLVQSEAPPTDELPAAPPLEARMVPPAPVVAAADPPPDPVPAPDLAEPSLVLPAVEPQPFSEPDRQVLRPAPAQPSPAGPLGSSAAPLAVIAGVVAVAGIALRAWELRARRRRRPSARAARAGRQAKIGSAAAVNTAARHLAGAAMVATDTASRTTRQLSEAASAASSTAARSGSTVTSTVSAIPPTVARRGRKARRSVSGGLWDAAAVGTAGGGYVLGAKAGRGRYEQINQQAQELANSPQIKALTDAVKDQGAGRRSSRR